MRPRPELPVRQSLAPPLAAPIRRDRAGGLGGRVASALAGWILFVAALWSAPIAAQDLLTLDREIDDVRGWTIGLNLKAGACLAKARYEDKTTVWFGFAEGAEGFFGLSNPRWRSIEPGKRYELQLIARGGSRWRGDFQGGDVGGERSLLSSGLKDSFMLDIARAGGIEVRYQGKSIARLSLSGSMAAVEATFACEKEVLAQVRAEQGRAEQARGDRPGSGQAKAPPGKGGEEGGSTGSGFFVSTSGHLVTNFHVIDGCKSVEITRAGAVAEPVQVLARDSINDLALLKAVNGPASVPALALRARSGDSVFVYGFPLAGLLASSGNFTVGNVTATSGLNDDSRMLQISAPVQPGNSGGPLMDQYGNIVGVVVAKLNALRLASVTNDLAQNVNFAIKASVAQTFLDGNTVTPPLAAATGTPLDAATIAEKAKGFTVFVRCH